MKRVMILLADGFEALEAAAFIDVLGWAKTFGSEPIELVTVGLRQKLGCTFGFAVIPDAVLADVDLNSFDAVAVPGGFESAGFYQDAYADEFLDVLRWFDSQPRPIAAVCVGALPLAKAGILAGRRATTYHLLGGKRREQLAAMGAEVVDAPLVRDRNVLTSTGPATAIDVAFWLLEELTSRENAGAIRTLMGYPQAPAQFDR
jgi:4-methyl-5(b-hydroxyethyl)-thiazole monophosphate biosynthesis